MTTATRFGGLAIINAGTLFRDDDPCFALVDFAAGTVQFVDVAAGGLEPGSVHDLGRPA